VKLTKTGAAPTRPRPGGPIDTRARAGLIAIGASTGGTQALETVLTCCRPTCRHVVVQHAGGFTAAFASRLNGVCPMEVVEAKGGEIVKRGTAYIAPGDYHMMVENLGIELKIVVRTGPLVHYQRPAVDVLFGSVARLQGISVVGLILTGMGADGADGMVAMRRACALTIAEAEESCVVFGMPKEAIARGGAVHVATLLQMPGLIFECFERLARMKAS
jgi:two-component system chemotaxis response regulator CheB